MAESIVKVPSNAGDMDFLAFSFNGKHSWDDFGIIRTSDGDRYNENLVPAMQDKTAEVPGGDGMYYFGTTHKQRDFNINIAFDNMSEIKYRGMRQWLNGKEMGDLWFSEAPYKVYTAKPTGTPSLKTLCFDVDKYITINKDNRPVGFEWTTVQETTEGFLFKTITYTHTVRYSSKYTYIKVLSDKAPQIEVNVNGTTLTIEETYNFSGSAPSSNIWVEFKFVERVYKGEGTIQFTAYWPYAHTPDYVEAKVCEVTIQPGEIYSFEEPLKIKKFEIKGLTYPTGGDPRITFTFIESESGAEIETEFEEDGAAELNEEISASGIKVGGEDPQKFDFYIFLNGKLFTSYEDFSNKYQWEATARLPDNTDVCVGENPGDVPAYFIVKAEDNQETASGDPFKVGDLQISADANTRMHGLQWDSKTGLVTALIGNPASRQPILYTGDSLGAIPVGGLPEEEINTDYAELKYHYWYY